ncbi:MAG: hypothetical protein ACRC5T_02275 [Cetobacterium sp.]
MKNLSKDISVTLKNEIKKTHQRREKEQIRDGVKAMIDDRLYNEKSGLPLEEYPTTDFIQPKIESLFSHMYTKYESYDRNVYY